MPAHSDKPCPKCGIIHNPALCQAHSKHQGGGQCKRSPRTGLTVCASHGGKSPAGLAKMKAAIIESEARKALGELNITPVTNPFWELQRLAGEALAWKQMCADRVAQLTSMRYSTDGGEAIRGEILLFERAMDRCVVVLAAIAKLRLDERLVALAESQKRMVLLALEAGLAAGNITGDTAAVVKRTAATHLRVINTRSTPEDLRRSGGDAAS